MHNKKILSICILTLLFYASSSIAYSESSTYQDWIGPLWNNSTTPMPTIDNPAFNQTLSAIWGNDTKNATLDDFDGPGIVGGLTAMFKGAAPVIVIVFGFLIAFVMYVKYDGSLLIPGMCFMATGCISGGLAYSWGAPIEMIVFCIFLIICGLAGALYEAIVGKQ